MQITGQVQQGKRVGRQLGFPTANIQPDNPALLPAQNGVYVARIVLADGRVLPCVLNKGRHPTLPEGAATVEAHILDFHEDLYGQRVRVEFLRVFPIPKRCVNRSPATKRPLAPGLPPKTTDAPGRNKPSGRQSAVFPRI